VRLEKRAETRTTLCEVRRISTCCCKTNESIEKDVEYKYGLG
jgi:hypothetical protein